MKKFVKVCLVMATAFVVLGTAITVGAASAGGVREVERLIEDGALSAPAKYERHVETKIVRLDWDDDDWDDHDWDDDWDDDDWDDDDWDDHHNRDARSDKAQTEKRSLGAIALTAEETVRVEKLDLDMKGGVLQILPAEDACIRAEADDPYNAVQMGISGNTFVIDDKVDKKLHKWFGVLKKRTVRLYLPKDMKFEGADIDIGGGILEAELLSAGKVDLDVGAGKIVVKNLNCDKMDGNVGAGTAKFQAAQIFDAEFDIGAGEMTYQGSIGKRLELDCGAGAARLELTDREADFNYELSATMGEVVLGDRVFSGMMEKQRIDNGAARYMELDSAMGSIALSFQE